MSLWRSDVWTLGASLQMLTGGLMIALASLLLDRTVVPMAAFIAICGVIAFVISRRIGTHVPATV